MVRQLNALTLNEVMQMLRDWVESTYLEKHGKSDILDMYDVFKDYIPDKYSSTEMRRNANKIILDNWHAQNAGVSEHVMDICDYLRINDRLSRSLRSSCSFTHSHEMTYEGKNITEDLRNGATISNDLARYCKTMNIVYLLSQLLSHGKVKVTSISSLDSGMTLNAYMQIFVDAWKNNAYLGNTDNNMELPFPQYW